MIPFKQKLHNALRDFSDNNAAFHRIYLFYRYVQFSFQGAVVNTKRFFRKHGDNIRDKVRLITVTLIDELTEAGEYIEAKRLINLAESVDDASEYGILARNVEGKFKDYYERE